MNSTLPLASQSSSQTPRQHRFRAAHLSTRESLEAHDHTDPADDDEYSLNDGQDLLLAALLDDVQQAAAASPAAVGDSVDLPDPPPLRSVSILDESFTLPRNLASIQQPPLAQNSIPAQDGGESNTRSLLERFRTAPKKALSVTDLAAPSWCELQYQYSLERFGKIKRTPAMDRGSKVHSKLEAEIHVQVPVDVQSREDFWALRLWNIVQGLRGLRSTGMARELELPGVVDGQVINGVLDQLSYTCPDPALEARLEAAESKSKAALVLPANQTTLSEFFGSQNSDVQSLESARARSGGKLYITDVKTSGAARMPKGVYLRSAMMQLMLYRRLVVALATDSVDASIVFKRYSLDATAPLSDSLIRQLATLDADSGRESSQSDDMSALEADVDIVAELLGHNSLEQMWRLMVDEFKLTMPDGADSLSKVLAAEFRRSDDGSVIGLRSFAYVEPTLEDYVSDELRWWRGEREPRGVDIEESFKCQKCEFAPTCTWRIQKADEHLERSRARQKSAA